VLLILVRCVFAVGVANQRLLSATRYSLALTGTLFGGTSSSLFYLLYRRVPEIRRLYAFSDVTRWVDHYGLWERQWDQSKPSEGGYGASTNIRRWNLRQRELPGIAPAVIRYLLPITLFGNITDLGYALPPINEVVETLDMPGRLVQQYEYITATEGSRGIRGQRGIREGGESGDSLPVFIRGPTSAARHCRAGIREGTVFQQTSCETERRNARRR
jgi:hypothetical protein